MKAIFAIALVLSLISLGQAQKCNSYALIYQVIEENLCPDLWKVTKEGEKETKGPQYNEKVVKYFTEVFKKDEAPAGTFKTEWKALEQFKDAKLCIKDDVKIGEVAIKPYDDVFLPVVKEYIEQLVEYKSFPQRLLASLQTIINDGCKKKEGVTNIDNIRVWAKTYTFKDGDATKSGTWLINELYKYRIWTIRAQARVFRGVWATLWTGNAENDKYTKIIDGKPQKFIISKKDYTAYKTDMQNAFKGWKKYNAAVLAMAKAYLTKFGAGACTTDDKYYKKIETLANEWIEKSCKDADCKEGAIWPLGTLNSFSGNDGAKFNEIQATAGKQSIEPTGRRILVDVTESDDIVSADTDDKGVKVVVDETQDGIKIGGVDKDGACKEGTNCTTSASAASTSTTATATATPSASESSNATILSVIISMIIVALF